MTTTINVRPVKLLTFDQVRCLGGLYLCYCNDCPSFIIYIQNYYSGYYFSVQDNIPYNISVMNLDYTNENAGWSANKYLSIENMDINIIPKIIP